MPWEDPTLDTDEAGTIDRILEGLTDRLDGWEPVEGAPEVALAEEIGREIAATNALAIESLQVALAGIGETVFGLTPHIGAAATLEVVVAINTGRAPGNAAGFPQTLNYTLVIPQGFTIVGGDVAFAMPADVTIVVTLPIFNIPYTDLGTGQTVYEHLYSGNVTIPGLIAQVEGDAGNIDPGTPLTVVTGHPVVRSVTTVTGATGGVDEETLLTYLDRLTTYLSTLRPGGVRADDLAAFARTVPGVYRTIGLDLYDPANPGTEHERTATLVGITSNGDPIGGLHKAALEAQLIGVREVNFQVFLMDPTYTPLALTTTITVSPGSDPDTVRAAVGDRLFALIDPATWGSTIDDPTAWVERTSLSVLDVAAAVGQVPGVASLVDVKINGSTATVQLPGPAALPATRDDLSDPSTVVVTVA